MYSVIIVYDRTQTLYAQYGGDGPNAGISVTIPRITRRSSARTCVVHTSGSRECQNHNTKLAILSIRFLA